MGKLVINHNKITPEKADLLVKLCPFGAISYEGGKQVFIDTERDTWNMDPNALELAFKKYPKTTLFLPIKSLLEVKVITAVATILNGLSFF